MGQGKEGMEKGRKEKKRAGENIMVTALDAAMLEARSNSKNQDLRPRLR